MFEIYVGHRLHAEKAVRPQVFSGFSGWYRARDPARVSVSS